MEVKLKGTKVLEGLINASEPVRVLEGGSRSSKSWSILQWILFFYCASNRGKRITITRERLTWLKSTVMKDFQEIVETTGINVTPTINLNRPDQVYHFNGNEIAFIGIDESQKLFGRKQHVVWVNEVIGEGGASDITKHQYDQLEMRTEEVVLMDFNPKAITHWVYDSVIPRRDCYHSVSTMLDNPFLPEKVCNTILSYEPTPGNIEAGTADEYMWKVYGLGQRAEIKGVVYSNVGYTKSIPEDYKWRVYGLDFGFTNDPTALIEVTYSGGDLYLREIIYKTGLTNTDISEAMKEAGVSGLIIADSAEPKSIEDLLRLGWSVESAVKGPDSVRNGIDTVKRYKLWIDEGSPNIKSERALYRWSENRQGESQNKPIDKHNHAMDAVRYAVMHQVASADTFFVI